MGLFTAGRAGAADAVAVRLAGGGLVGAGLEAVARGVDPCGAGLGPLGTAGDSPTCLVRFWPADGARLVYQSGQYMSQYRLRAGKTDHGMLAVSARAVTEHSALARSSLARARSLAVAEVTLAGAERRMFVGLIACLAIDPTAAVDALTLRLDHDLDLSRQTVLQVAFPCLASSVRP